MEVGESSSASIEDQIMNLAKTKLDGITSEHIKESIPDTPPEVWAKIINKFLKSGVLELFKDKNQLFYKYKDPSKRTVNKGSDSEEKIVYKIIEEAGNIGIWVRDIRHKSSLNMTQLNKVLKSLEAKKIIKAVNSVSAGKKKVYMLYDVEPDSSVTGGAWYQDQDFESEFVDVLNQQCERYLTERLEDSINQGGGPLLVRNRSYATSEDVHKFISDLGISKVKLTVDDLESILYTLVLDNKAERIVNQKGVHLYRAVNSFLASPGLVKSTCGICPVVNRCSDIGSTNPKSCLYLNDWLNDL